MNIFLRLNSEMETLRKPTFLKVAEIDPNARGVNLVAKCMSVSDPVNGVFEVVLGDDTGIVTLRSTEQCKPGSTLVLRNSRVSMFRGRLRLEIDKWGKLASADSASFSVNCAKDISAVEYELVDF